MGERLTVATLGADIRSLRKSRGMTLIDLATALGRSVGWLSQVERDKSHPSIADLGRISSLLDVSLSSFMQVSAKPEEDGIIVRASSRRPIGSRTPGLVEGLLSPDLTDDFEVIHSRFEPGATSGDPIIRQTQEVGYIVSGRFDLNVGGRAFSLTAGDSFRLRGELFTWRNPSHETCEIIWVISPPVY
ncbi:cupin domain-containing protein [Yoonia litorea]|uniref:Transcriptional regulator, XRE family with cupin sensor n=1 Tax=Yoonia litorea TaxID=1123755 RepID=A0A1I6MZP6_9RHOB|nr:cupin domain-containing protein [Yoonia litorea]SFS21154.1 transcriptional regulator, XRE family with cupin sensor [Yoonia litorea]